MKNIFGLLFVVLIIFPLKGITQSKPPSPPNIAAKGYLLIDFKSGKILAEQASSEKLDPASITKLMTAYTVFKSIKSGQIGLDDEVLISEKAWRTQGSRMFIEAGKKVKVTDLLKGMIIQSGNDASVALAEHAAGTEETFVQIMNQLAIDLGMSNTNYTNSTGLSNNNHYTSASDIAKLAKALIEEFPDYYRWYSEKQYTFNGIKQSNRNSLLWRDESVDGIKTGYTENAGYCLVASAEREGMRLISIVLGTESASARSSESQALLNYGFRFYETYSLWGENESISNERVWKGESDSTELVVKNQIFVTLPRNNKNRVIIKKIINEVITAPINTNTKLGSIQAELDGEIIAKASLYSSEIINEGNFFTNAWDELLILLK